MNVFLYFRTGSIRAAVKRNVTLEARHEEAHGKFTPLHVRGVQKVIDGITSIEEVIRAIY
jgi:type II secretory ATPase GspE/PulE/Tfp pilus assembly ATPase PilB-like protein